jgi:hypothetical protein
MDTEATSPVADDDTADATVTDDTEVEDQGSDEAEAPELDDEGNPIDPDEDFDLDDDLKITVPKTVADKLKELKEGSLRQADYTRKTQELAEAKRGFETERAQVYQSTQAELNAFAASQNIAQQLAAYQQVDWPRWFDEDPFEAQKGDFAFRQLKEAHTGAINQLSFLHQQRQAAAQQETVKRIGEGREVLKGEIPGWNDDLRAKLVTFASGYGFTAQELDDIEADPRVAKVLHAAFTGSDATRKAKAATKHLEAQKVQPAAKVGGVTAIPSNRLDDRLSPDEWLKRRNKQVEAQGRR